MCGFQLIFITNGLYGASAISENCAIIDIVSGMAQLVGSADQVDFPVAPLGDIYIPFVFPSSLLSPQCIAIPAGSLRRSNRKYNIEMNSLIERACLHRVKFAGAINQLHPVKSVIQMALNCSATY